MIMYEGVEMNNTKYRVDLPYPEVIVNCPDLHDARILREDYAGRVSETTATLQYMYQHYILSEIEEEIADALEGIAIAEMHHHELLGKAITALGGDPIIGGMSSFFSGGYVNYCKNTKELLETNIMGEYAAIRNYRKSISCLYNTSVKELLERIILDEELHIKILNSLLEKYCKS